MNLKNLAWIKAGQMDDVMGDVKEREEKQTNLGHNQTITFQERRTSNWGLARDLLGTASRDVLDNP